MHLRRRSGESGVQVSATASAGQEARNAQTHSRCPPRVRYSRCRKRVRVCVYMYCTHTHTHTQPRARARTHTHPLIYIYIYIYRICQVRDTNTYRQSRGSTCKADPRSAGWGVANHRPVKSSCALRFNSPERRRCRHPS
jgi:hypothetical protein